MFPQEERPLRIMQKLFRELVLWSTHAQIPLCDRGPWSPAARSVESCQLSVSPRTIFSRSSCSHLSLCPLHRDHLHPKTGTCKCVRPSWLASRQDSSEGPVAPEPPVGWVRSLLWLRLGFSGCPTFPPQSPTVDTKDSLWHASCMQVSISESISWETWPKILLYYKYFMRSSSYEIYK